MEQFNVFKESDIPEKKQRQQKPPPLSMSIRTSGVIFFSWTAWAHLGFCEQVRLYHDDGGDVRRIFIQAANVDTLADGMKFTVDPGRTANTGRTIGRSELFTRKHALVPEDYTHVYRKILLLPGMLEIHLNPFTVKKGKKK